MSEKDPSNKNDPSKEDEDFGLPKVKFTPIGPEKKVTEEGSLTPVANKERVTSPKGSPETTEKTKGNGILILLLFLILAIGLGSLFYFGFFESNKEKAATQPAEQAPIAAVPAPPVEKPDDTAGLPEAKVKENVLAEITGRAAAPRYFVVVGSFIDDDLAKDYSSRLNKLGNPTFLIHPYGDISYYRLAVAQYDNVKQALEEMEDQQGNFEENLWVLKY